jgi:hypothetical protein
MCLKSSEVGKEEEKTLFEPKKISVVRWVRIFQKRMFVTILADVEILSRFLQVGSTDFIQNLPTYVSGHFKGGAEGRLNSRRCCTKGETES